MEGSDGGGEVAWMVVEMIRGRGRGCRSHGGEVVWISSIHGLGVGVRPSASMGVHDEGVLGLLVEIEHGSEDGVLVAPTKAG